MDDSNPPLIDAVITWVDGDDPAHRRLRQRYMAQTKAPLHENAVNTHRWASGDEILYCLRSIEINAPWIRRIWIVTDGSTPHLDDLSDTLRGKIYIAYHRDLFHGFDDALPTFNSLAIESLIWRIPNLTERFLYFNDDVFLTDRLGPADVFVGHAPVLRGEWVDYRAIEGAPSSRDDPALFNHFMQINAARMLGFAPDRLFDSAHVVHPLRRSLMRDLFDRHADRFRANVAHRFRDLGQFLPQGLHNHACIAADQAVISTADDHLHIQSGYGADFSADQMRAYLAGVLHPGIKVLCVNDLPQLENVLPEARDWLLQAIGAAP